MSVRPEALVGQTPGIFGDDGSRQRTRQRPRALRWDCVEEAEEARAKKRSSRTGVRERPPGQAGGFGRRRITESSAQDPKNVGFYFGMVGAMRIPNNQVTWSDLQKGDSGSGIEKGRGEKRGDQLGHYCEGLGDMRRWWLEPG